LTDRAAEPPARVAFQIPDLMAATGLFERCCSPVRLGKKVPHGRHWQAVREVANDLRARKLSA